MGLNFFSKQHFLRQAKPGAPYDLTWRLKSGKGLHIHPARYPRGVSDPPRNLGSPIGELARSRRWMGCPETGDSLNSPVESVGSFYPVVYQGF